MIHVRAIWSQNLKLSDIVFCASNLYETFHKGLLGGKVLMLLGPSTGQNKILQERVKLGMIICIHILSRKCPS